MKNFSRTVAGKTAAFMICILSICLLAGFPAHGAKAFRWK